MKAIYKIFKQDPNTREGVITVTSWIGILLNILIAVTKILVGMFAASVSIVSSGFNNATDALSSVLTLVGAKLANNHPDQKHPFGYGRIEYIVSLIIGTMILLTGVEMLQESVKKIFNPATLKISYISLIILAVTAVVKLFLGLYTVKMGRKAESQSLIGVGLESRDDSIASAVTIAAAIIFLLFRVSLDAYAGIIVALLILKASYSILKETVSDLIGRPGKRDLAVQLYHEIRNTPGILAAADLMLHNYGPGHWSGSVNLEIDHEDKVGDVYVYLHKLQLRIMHEYHVTMVFGIYAVDNDHEEMKGLRKDINSFIKNHEYMKSFHALYLDHDNHTIYCDIVLNYGLEDWDALRREFVAYMEELYPGNHIELTLETEYV